jgi:hypothetical protein
LNSPRTFNFDAEAIAGVITRQVRYDGGWKNAHSIYLASLHPIDRDALVEELPVDVLEAMAGVS